MPDRCRRILSSVRRIEALAAPQPRCHEPTFKGVPVRQEEVRRSSLANGAGRFAATHFVTLKVAHAVSVLPCCLGWDTRPETWSVPIVPTNAKELEFTFAVRVAATC